MNDTNRELEDLLARILDAPDGERTPALDAACGERPELAARLRERVAALERLGLVDGRHETLPTAIGSWTPVARLGRGGMSVVWLAERADGARAAIKVLDAPTGFAQRSQARFAREIRAFEGLEHLSVVRLLDSGEHEGRPWYAMEYSAGATLAAVVEELRTGRNPADATFDPAALGPLAIDAAVRAALPAVVAARSPATAAWGRTWIECAARAALDVADGLAYLHARGIVHRDVKPGNVLLRLDGRAQLFDLGLARVDDEPSLTDTGDFAGTPFYVSPEQARGQRDGVDGRTDVYALGATLYELLTLRRPFEGGGTAEVLLRIQTEEPVPPRRIAPNVPRDLETICLTALEKDPHRRYAGAGEMAEDLRRFLAWQPVHARPIGTIAKGARFARRRPGAATAAALAVLIAVGLPTGLGIANKRIRGERDRAEASALEAGRQAALRERAAEFLVDLFHTAGGEGASARDLLATGARSVQTGFEDQPLARAFMLEALGRGYMNLGLPSEALPLFDRCFALRLRELGEDHPDTARALLELGHVQLRLARPEVAVPIFQRGLEALERAEHGRGPAWARGAIALAEARDASGDAAGAGALLEGALDVLRRAGRSDGPEAIEALERAGRVDLALGEPRRATERLEEALALLSRAWRPDLTARARVLDALSEAAAAEGDTTRAAGFAAQASAIRAAPRTAGAAWTPADTRALVAAFEAPWRAGWRASFQSGITALQARSHAEAAAAFERCVELRPGDSAAPYNLACARIAEGDTNGAYAAMEQAVAAGLAHFPERVEAFRRDVDIGVLRGEPRWAELDRRVERARLDGESWAREPALVLPEGAAPPAGWPLVVLLHRDGSSKDIEARGAWADFARRERAALLVPAARYAASEDPRVAGAWLSDVEDLARRPWRSVEPALEDVRRTVAAQPIDRGRVIAVGFQTGAPVAFDMACRASGLFRAAILVEGALHAEAAAASAPAAALLGLDLSLVVEDREGVESRIELLRRALGALGFEAGAIAVRKSPAGGAEGAALEAARAALAN
ncbi:MAG: protein kinase [Planctomycetota bacterium]|nr:protein kinase [Planctomycetota bacterium]